MYPNPVQFHCILLRDTYIKWVCICWPRPWFGLGLVSFESHFTMLTHFVLEKWRRVWSGELFWFQGIFYHRPKDQQTSLFLFSMLKNVYTLHILYTKHIFLYSGENFSYFYSWIWISKQAEWEWLTFHVKKVLSVAFFPLMTKKCKLNFLSFSVCCVGVRLNIFLIFNSGNVLNYLTKLLASK